MNPYQPNNQNANGESFVSVDSEGVPSVTPDPIRTQDIEVCGGCGCMELTAPEHHAMFPTKEAASGAEVY
jgi:hypothetical protein